MENVNLCSKAVTAWVSLIQTSDALKAKIESAFKAEKLPNFSCYHILYELKHAEQDFLRPYELQQLCNLQQYQLSRILDRMAKQGWIGRYECEQDGRGQFIKITDEGFELLKKMHCIYAECVMTSLSAKLDTNEIEQLVSILKKLDD